MRVRFAKASSVAVSLLSAASLAALLGSGCADTKECALIACNSTTTVRMLANVTANDLANAVLTACRSDPSGSGCSSSAGHVITPPVVDKDRIPIALSGSLDARAFVYTPEPGKGYRVEVIYNLEGISVANGDTYELKLDLNGTSLASLKEAATYEVLRPNGPDCPPVCRTATIDKS